MRDKTLRRHWVDLIRRARLGRTVTAIALALAFYADPDGTRVHPGLVRLAYETEFSYNTCKEVLALLRDLDLIRKVGKVGNADDYVLNIPSIEHLYDNGVGVPTPGQVEIILQRARKQKRGKSHHPRKDTRPARQAAPIDADSSAQPTARAAQDTPRGPLQTPENDRAAHSTSAVRPVRRAATRHDISTTETTHANDVRPQLAVVDPARPGEDHQIDRPKRGRCPHGRSDKRRRGGLPRCPECRTQAEEATTPTAGERAIDSTPATATPAKCTEHGLHGGNRPDGLPRCPLCRKLRTIPQLSTLEQAA